MKRKKKGKRKKNRKHNRKGKIGKELSIFE
jgi:hypothetical protein